MESRISSPKTVHDAEMLLTLRASGQTKKYVLGETSDKRKEWLETLCDFDYTLKKVLVDDSLNIIVNGKIYDLTTVQIPVGYSKMLEIRNVYATPGVINKRGKSPYWKPADAWANEKYVIDGTEYKPKMMSTFEIDEFIYAYNRNQNDDRKINTTDVKVRNSKVLADFGSLLSKDGSAVVANSQLDCANDCLAYYMEIKTPFEDNLVVRYELPEWEVRSTWLLYQQTDKM